MPTTSSVSQLTTNSTNHHNLNDENTKHISKQYVSDYILSQPFDNNEKDDDELKRLGAKQKITSPMNEQTQRKRLLPTAHLRQQSQPQKQKESSFEQDDDAATSLPESASPVDDNESLRHGKEKQYLFNHIFSLI